MWLLSGARRVFERDESFCLGARKYVLQPNAQDNKWYDEKETYIMMENAWQSALGPEFGVHDEVES
jgi:hypothetical protein